MIVSNSSSNEDVEKLKTQLTIHPKNIIDEDSSSMLNGGQLEIQLKDTKEWKPVAGAKIYVTLQNINTGENKTFETILNEEGISYITVNVESGEYTAYGLFKGDEKYYRDTTDPYITIIDHYQEITQSSKPLRDGVDYDSSSLSPKQWDDIVNNPGGHYDLGGNYYAPGEGQ